MSVASRPAGGRGRPLLPVSTVLERLVASVGTQQHPRVGTRDQSHELAVRQDQGPFVRVFGGLCQLGLVVGAVFRTVHPHTVGRLHQVVAQIGVAGLGHAGVFRLEVAGLMDVPDQAGILGVGAVVGEALDIADFGDEASSPDRSQPWDRVQQLRDGLELAGDGGIDCLELGLQGFDRRHGRAQHEGKGFVQPVGIAGRALPGAGEGLGSAAAAPALAFQVRRQLVQRALGQLFRGEHLQHGATRRPETNTSGSRSSPGPRSGPGACENG